MAESVFARKTGMLTWYARNSIFYTPEIKEKPDTAADTIFNIGKGNMCVNSASREILDNLKR